MLPYKLSIKISFGGVSTDQMLRAFRFLFNLYPGEEKKSGLFLLLGLLWGTGIYGTLTLSEGMFLEYVGSSALPQAYFFSSLFVCGCSFLIVKHLSTRKSSSCWLLVTPLTISLIFNLILVCLLLFFSPEDLRIFWILYKVMGWGLTILSFATFWTFVDAYFDLQDGKRCFCMLNAVIFLGDALGGGSIPLLIHKIGLLGLLSFFSSCILLALPLIFFIVSQLKSVSEEFNIAEDHEHTLSFKKVAGIIIHSRFTVCLVAFYFLMQVLAIISDYSYSQSISEFLSHAGKHAVTAFIGKAGLLISCGNMIFAFFIYSRLVKKVGVNNIIVIAPLAFFVLFSLWIGRATFLFAILGMVAREGLTYALDDNNLQLLVSAVPNRIRNQIRVIIESFVEPLSMLLCSGFCFMFPFQQRLFGLIFATICLVLVFIMRAYYPSAIFYNLSIDNICFHRKGEEHLKKLSKKEKHRAEVLLLSSLRSSTEKEQLIAFEYLLKIGTYRVLPRLLNHINKLSLPAKLKAFQLFEESRWAKDALILELLDRWLRMFPHPAITSTIHLYFAKHDLLDPQLVIQDLHSPYTKLKAAAILTIKKQRENTPYYQIALKNLSEMLNSDDDHEIYMALRILGLEENEENIDYILPFLSHVVPSIQEVAAKSLFAIIKEPLDPSHSTSIIKALPKMLGRESRSFALQALEKIIDDESIKSLLVISAYFRASERGLVERIAFNLGPSIIEILLETIKDNHLHDRARLTAAKVLHKIDNDILKKYLDQILQDEIKKAYFYLYHACNIQNQHPSYDLGLLLDTLNSDYYSVLDFIIQLICISASFTNSESLTTALKHKNKKIKAQAQESLERASSRSVFKRLVILLDRHKHSEIIQQSYLTTGGTPLSLVQLLDMMSASPFIQNQIVSRKLIKDLNLKEFCCFTIKDIIQEHP